MYLQVMFQMFLVSVRGSRVINKDHIDIGYLGRQLVRFLSSLSLTRDLQRTDSYPVLLSSALVWHSFSPEI